MDERVTIQDTGRPRTLLRLDGSPLQAGDIAEGQTLYFDSDLRVTRIARNRKERRALASNRPTQGNEHA